jgi:glycosyltransferase involved in cell wall biosynthesis
MGIEVVYAPFAYKMTDFLQKRGSEFDVVYITRYYVAKNHLASVRYNAPNAKILFCNADLHFLRELREAVMHNNPEMLKQACLVRDEELNLMRQVDVVLSYNTIEHAVILSHNLNSSTVATCPWVVDIDEEITPFYQREDIAFLGGFGHPPNKAAVLFFIQEVMPLLREQLPDVKFRIYGSNMSDELKQLASADIIIEGYIENVADIYHGCRVFVAPLLTGAGIKGKVIDALAHGTPSVISNIAAEGTSVRHGLEAMIANTLPQWVESVVQLYTDESLWQAVSQAARDYARQHYSFAQGQQQMQYALQCSDFFASLDNTALVVDSTRL